MVSFRLSARSASSNLSTSCGSNFMVVRRLLMLLRFILTGELAIKTTSGMASLKLHENGDVELTSPNFIFVHYEGLVMAPIGTFPNRRGLPYELEDRISYMNYELPTMPTDDGRPAQVPTSTPDSDNL